MEYDNTNRGVLFRNETANEENKQPYMTGKINIEGKDLDLAGWMKESKSGRKFQKRRVQETIKAVRLSLPKEARLD